MDEFVKKEDCCPWHIFTYGKVKSKIGNDALKEYQKQKDDKVYCYIGNDYKNGLCEIINNNYNEIINLIDYGDEIYLTSLDFSWTFVITHEQLFDPYFIKK